MGNIDLLIGMLIEKKKNRDVNKNPINDTNIFF